MASLSIKFDKSSSTINLTLNNRVEDKVIPLDLQFKYDVSSPYAPIRQVGLSRNDKIKEHYWNLWNLSSASRPSFASLNLSDTFEGETVTISQDEIDKFCRVVGNENEAYKGEAVPLDFAIKLGWRSIIKPIFPPAIDGDLLKLVHLSNGFRVVPNAPALKPGDTVTSKSRIESVVNSDSGKSVAVKGIVYLVKGEEHIPVLEVLSSFLYRGTFSDYAQTFSRTQAPVYEVTIDSAEKLATLNSKEWFDWEAEEPLAIGTVLEFATESSFSYADKSSYSKVVVTGAITSYDSHGKKIHLGNVRYNSEGLGSIKGDPVVEYLKRHGKALSQPISFENGGYSLAKSGQCVFKTPASNLDYSLISGDTNPIHTNPYFAALADLPGTITHGMHTSAKTRKFVEQYAAQSVPTRVLSYDVNFTAMCLPDHEMEVKIKHIGQTSNGNKLIDVKTVDLETGATVLAGTAEVRQTPTAYVFTGQGSQEPGMGMELYSQSPVARAVWDEADKHLLEVYGFSILEIVRNNPKEKTIHFGGLKGMATRSKYMDMTYTTTDTDGNIKTLPLFNDITLRTSRYTFSSPTGLLYATQFAQIALVVTEKAYFEDMRAKGLYQDSCMFAGHSLGEYSALASIASVLPISSLVDVVFYRGITMQRAVERDSQNRSSYGMVAVNPSRIAPSFTEPALREVVDTIVRKGDILIEVVNYNVEGQQYVVAGHLIALQTLTNVLNFLKIQKIDLAKLTEIMTIEEVKEKLELIVEDSLAKARELAENNNGYISLERGFATIPLPGIDVPFHSRYLWAGVMPFRSYLSKKIQLDHLNVDLLVGRYIPNLTAKVYEVTKEYAELIYTQTNSPRLGKILAKWDEEEWGTAANRNKLGYYLLIELLAYQFASPVRWIETQDILFKSFKFERLVELGPSPTLTGMASRTQKLKYEAYDAATGIKREIYCVAKNGKEIYYQYEDEEEEVEAAPAASSAPAPAAPAAAAAAPVAVAAAAPVAAAAEVADVPLQAVDTLRVIIAQKLKKSIAEIALTKSIKDLVAGKSTLQNEILGDLQGEFANAPEKGEEMPLSELGSALQAGYSGSLGKYTSGLVNRLVGSKMPGGFSVSVARGYLNKTYGLGQGRQDGVLLYALTQEPAKRLGSEAEAKAFFDTAAQAYAQQAGISLSSGGGAAAASGGATAAVAINPEILDKLQEKQDNFIKRQLEVLMKYLGKDSREGHRMADAARAEYTELQGRLDAINREHGEEYINGIQPVFDARKARHFNSYWNWVRQDALMMWMDIIFGRLTTVDRDITARCLVIMNRVDDELLKYMQYTIDRVPTECGENYKLAKVFGQQLLDNCREMVNEAPLHRDITFPTAPKTTVSEKGDIIVEEVNRPGVSRLEKYVAEMAAGTKMTSKVDLERVQEHIEKLYKLVKSQPQISKTHMSSIKALYGEAVRGLGASAPAPKGRGRRPSNQFLRPQAITESISLSSDKVPLLHLKRKVGTNWQYSSKLTSLYLDVLKEIATSGVTFEHKNALMTGVGKGSIGIEIVKGLLAGGARVIITTSRYSRSTVEYYQKIYQEVGSKGSQLTVVPFNQGSKQDVDALVDYIYNDLNMDLDYILPFAALPENGREIDSLDDRSELAHRIMLTNLLRIMGAVKSKKAALQLETRPTEVILPLSPNHGLFGNDGLYSESKISLETLFSRWSSESWGDYLCIAGAVIGWTRGTGLMSATNSIAEGIEKHGVRTFSAKEMAFNILGLMHPLLFDVAQIEPVWADLNGGMDKLTDLAQITKDIRVELNETASTRRAVSIDNAADFKVTHGIEAEQIHHQIKVAPRANFSLPFPELKPVDATSELAQLRGLIDLEKVVVIAGFAEVGPFGSSRTRWEVEANGSLSIQGTLELAYVMGLIKHFDGALKDGSLYVGWVDAKTNEPLDDQDVKAKYEKHILEHTGIRLIEPDLFNGYDPHRKGFTQEIEIQHDLEAFEASEEDAAQFKLEHGDKVDVYVDDAGQTMVRFRQGAKLNVPKAIDFQTLVAGQIPTGWSHKAFGIPDDIAAQVDRTSLWALVAVSEALMMAGITDPYEMYKYVHPSQVGTALGSGMGGMVSLRKMFIERREEKDVQKDILQETFINTVAGWVNLLLLSSSGPIKTPVGACATAIQSLDIAVETILSGKAKVMVAGGYDDFSEEGSYEFANMKATSNSHTEFAAGREPTEMSRPTTSTRSGFMESQGCGAQVLMSAKTALEMGASVYGIVAFSSTATDKAGRSIPAPGLGVMGTAREVKALGTKKILDVSYRRRQLAFRRKQISDWLLNEISLLKEDESTLSPTALTAQLNSLEKEAHRQEQEALAHYGMLVDLQDDEVSPLRRALAVWGLTIDDIGAASFHGTSTVANDKNESNAYNEQFRHLGRTAGNACPVIAQKWLTGHPKGGAAAWMLNGITQVIQTGIIPGNRNADNISAELRAMEFLVYPSKSIQTDGIKAGVLTSFGFGQVGGQGVVVHPKYLLGSLEPNEFDAYKVKNDKRKILAYKKFNEFFTKGNMVQIKEHAPYDAGLENSVLLNPLARAEPDKEGSYAYSSKSIPTAVSVPQNHAKVAAQLAAQASDALALGMGTDVELISSVPADNATFVARNFTAAEISYCETAPDFRASLAGKWVAKEAVFKSLGTPGKGAGAALQDIEIISTPTGPTVTLHGDAKAVAEQKGITSFKLSISHSDDVALAVAVAQK